MNLLTLPLLFQNTYGYNFRILQHINSIDSTSLSNLNQPKPRSTVPAPPPSMKYESAQAEPKQYLYRLDTWHTSMVQSLYLK